jgi:hypothetical protein
VSEGERARSADAELDPEVVVVMGRLEGEAGAEVEVEPEQDAERVVEVEAGADLGAGYGCEWDEQVGVEDLVDDGKGLVRTDAEPADRLRLSTNVGRAIGFSSLPFERVNPPPTLPAPGGTRNADSCRPLLATDKEDLEGTRAPSVEDPIGVGDDRCAEDDNCGPTWGFLHSASRRATCTISGR